MLKLFFKSMWYGISAFYQEIRPLILLYAFTFTPIIVLGIIGIIFPSCKDYLMLLAIIGAIVGFMLCSNYMHYTEAVKYAEENEVSFEEAWWETKPDDDDGMY